MSHTNPKIYHITHIDNLISIIADGHLLCDAEIMQSSKRSMTIGMNRIKQRRLSEIALHTYPELFVGACVPFYFCPRSVMLYLIHKSNHGEISYRGGQEPIVHLVADLRNVVAWAEQHKRRWVFTDSNAGSRYFNEFTDLSEIGRLDWQAVTARNWRHCREQKQAELLIEKSVPWHLIEKVGTYSQAISQQVATILTRSKHQPLVDIRKDWYY